jgi:hypothetical protein
MGLLVAPSVEPTLQVKLSQLQLFKEGSEHPNEVTVEPGVVLVADLINQVEITTQNPRTCMRHPYSPELIQEDKLSLVALRPVDDREPPRRFERPMF